MQDFEEREKDKVWHWKHRKYENEEEDDERTVLLNDFSKNPFDPQHEYDEEENDDDNYENRKLDKLLMKSLQEEQKMRRMEKLNKYEYNPNEDKFAVILNKTLN